MLRGYLYALRVLTNNELPPAYLRSLPIARFQQQLHHTVYELENEARSKSET